MTAPLERLQRDKRILFRTIIQLKASLTELSKETPSLDNVQKAGVFLDSWIGELKQVADVDRQLCLHIDMEKCNTPELIEKAENAIIKDYEKSFLEFNKLKGEFVAIKSRLEKDERANQSILGDTMNSTFQHFDRMNSLAKLPDIDVPKFDGDIDNYTEWQSLFDAIIDSNEALKPQQKMFFLKNAMIGKANTILKDYPIEGSLYESAYEHVKKRYYNRRKIIENHFRTLFELPSINASNLRENLDKVHATVRGMKACNLDVVKMSPMIAFALVRKLPERIRQDWENSQHDYSMYPTYEPLATWLNTRCFALESSSNYDSSRKVSAAPRSSNTPQNTKTSNDKPKSSLPVTNSSNAKSSNTFPTAKCHGCGEAHYFSQCNDFLSKSIADRDTYVTNKRLCRNCLRPGHTANQCRSSKCRKCGNNHHTLLHVEPISTNSVSSPAPETKSSLAVIRSNMDVLLPTAVVKVRIGTRYVLARALIDSCSQVNLVTESFVNRYRLEKSPSATNVLGVSPASVKSNYVVSLHLHSRLSDFQIRLDAEVIGALPYSIAPHLMRQIELLDQSILLAESGMESTSVDILIGAQFASRITTGEKKFIEELCLENSELGWLTVGPVRTPIPDPKCCCVSIKVHDALAKFWETEEISPPKITSSENELFDAHFQETRIRLPSGRFQIRLPFKSASERLANTYQQARNALLKYEKSNPSIRSQYVDFMRDYLERGHMRPANDNQSITRYYIPHLPVVREDSSTTKLRVVFNASAKNKSGVSLNDTLLNGPIRQPPLFNTLIQFRQHVVAFSADIEKMYRQIEVHEEDRHFQSILWRFHTNDEIQTYELTTLTYGTVPAAAIATECLNESGNDVTHEYPEVAEAIQKEFWVDDLLSGDSSVEKAITKAQRIHNTLLQAKFPLRKYVSNSREFLDSLPPDQVEKLRPVSFSSEGVAKILGLQWHPAEDEFRINFKTAVIERIKLTKRVVSSLIASVYDPLGLVNPILVRGKILLQDLWREGLDWDDPVPEKIESKFRDYYSDLENLSRIHVSRPYSTFHPEKIKLIGFSDASDKAYGAVVYVKSCKSTSTGVNLVCSKSKVAPLKDVTIPRLELLGTVVLCKLISAVADALHYNVSQATVFCDSTVVLAWLKGPASKYETFVRNRIEYVTSILPMDRWHYVRTNENPADLVTRGVSVNTLIENQLWLHGPPWLMHECEIVEVELPTSLPETRKTHISLITTVMSDESLITRYSSLDKLVRIMTLVKTFLTRLREKSKNATVSTQEAVNNIYRISQIAWFPTESHALKNGDSIHSKSRLTSLDPFFDSKSVLRVGGRLRHSRLSYDVKYPIILHAKSELAKLLVRHVHEKYYHASQAFTRTYVLRRFWIVTGIRSLVRNTFANCVWCTRMKAEPVSQIMGDLPAERTVIARPFTNSSVDYAGPFTIRCTNHRTQKYLKHYAAFFVCMVTRAVHIESVADLSTKAFIAAFQRFIARRGVPAVIWSDNATNFVGTKNYFDSSHASLGMQWKFIPPRSPHHGGVWESAVKAGKKYLLAVSKDAILTEDQFKTTFAIIESIMNSRPLYQRRSVTNFDEIDVLTPGHFLVNSHLLEPCDSDLYEISLLERHSLQQQIVSSFWTKWKQSYLAQLQSRTKWKRKSPNLKIGDIVIVKEPTSPCNWPLARIIEGKPDAKGQLRIVTINTKNSKYIRSVQQLVKLPVEEADSEESTNSL